MKVLGEMGKAFKAEVDREKQAAAAKRAGSKGPDSQQSGTSGGSAASIIVGADDFMPMLIFTILRVNPNRVWSNLE